MPRLLAALVVMLVVATASAFVCTAFIADPGNAPPTSMTYLTIVSKLKQKAAN